MSELNQDEQIQVNQYYGVKSNIREKPKDAEKRFDILDKLNVTMSSRLDRALILFGVTALSIGFSIVYGSQNWVRFFHELPGLIAINIAIIVLLTQFALLYPSSGSILSNSINMIGHLFERYLVKSGKVLPSRKTKLSSSRNDGTIIADNGDFMRVFYIDGSTSNNAYPEEIAQREELAIRYHNGRKRSTTETIITSSQKQNAEQQIENLENMNRFEENQALKDIRAMDIQHLRQHVDGVKPSIIQYLILRDSRERDLDESVERLNRFSQQGLYYSLQQLNKEKAERVLGNFLSLK